MAVSKIRQFTLLPIAPAHLGFFHIKPGQARCFLHTGKFTLRGQQPIVREIPVQAPKRGAFRAPQLSLLHSVASRSSATSACKRLFPSCAASNQISVTARSTLVWATGSKLRSPVSRPAFSCIWFRGTRNGSPPKSTMAQSSSAVGQGSTGQASAPSRYAIFITGSLLGGLAYSKTLELLLTGHASPYTEEKYGGYGQLLETLLREPGEEWERFVVLEGKFPTAEQLAKFDGFVLTGSRHDAHADEPWILQLVDLLKEAFAKKQRILGICFGHQVLCRALGGTTGRSTAGWEMGLREVKVNERLRAKPYGAGLPATVHVYESHQDQASVIPPGGELLGASERTPIEIFAVGDVALGFQGHPEFNLDVLTDLIEDRRAKGVLTNEEADAALESAYETTADTKAIQEFCIAFLKGKHVSDVQAEKPLDEVLEKN